MSISPTTTHGRRFEADPSLGWPSLSLLELLFLWDERWRARRRLLAMDDRMLRDVGIGRGEAAIEAGKPFWRA